MDDLLTIEEATALLGKSRQTVYNMLKDGRLPPAARLGRLRRWRRSTVEAVIEREAELMSSVEVAQWLGISRNTAKIWVQEGRLPEPIQWGKVIRWERSVLEQTIAAAEREAAEAAPPLFTCRPAHKADGCCCHVSRGLKPSKGVSQTSWTPGTF